MPMLLMAHGTIVVTRPSECTLRVGRNCLSNATAHGSVAECTTDRFRRPGAAERAEMPVRLPSDQILNGLPQVFEDRTHGVVDLQDGGDRERHELGVRQSVRIVDVV